MALSTRRPRRGSLDFLEGETQVRPEPLDILGNTELPTGLLPYLVEMVEKRRANNLDTYIVCAGREGWGKSSLGLTGALAIDPDLDPEDIIFDEEDYYRVYDPSQNDQVYVFDEAGELFFNRDWNNSGQRGRIKDVIANRQNRDVVFLHLPQVKILDKYLREGRIHWWFACKEQGQAMIRELAYNAYEEKAYYPIKIDDHFWSPLEISHPEFAEVYYDRKEEKRIDNFEQRRREQRAKREEAKADTGHKNSRQLMAEASD